MGGRYDEEFDQGIGATGRVGYLIYGGVTRALANITYVVDDQIGVGSVVGSIATDGVIGTLPSGNFVSWNLSFNGNGASTTISNTDAGAVVYVAGSGVVATSAEITFDFDDSSSVIFFQDGFDSGEKYWSNAGGAGPCSVPGKYVAPIYFTDPTSILLSASGTQVISGGAPETSTWAMLLIGFAGIGFAGYRPSRKSGPLAD